jgi:hypothetical protein
LPDELPDCTFRYNANSPQLIKANATQDTPTFNVDNDTFRNTSQTMTQTAASSRKPAVHINLEWVVPFADGSCATSASKHPLMRT